MLFFIEILIEDQGPHDSSAHVSKERSALNIIIIVVVVIGIISDSDSKLLQEPPFTGSFIHDSDIKST